jgi:hypothetical protein
MTARGLAALKALPRYNGTSECDVSVPSGKEELSFRQSGHDNSLDDCFPRLQLGDEQRFVPALAVTCARQMDQPAARSGSRFDMRAQCDAGGGSSLGHALAVPRDYWHAHEIARCGKLIEAPGRPRITQRKAINR